MGAPKATVYAEDLFAVVKVGPMGPYGNNAYLLHDAGAKASLLVDMPLDERPLLDAIAEVGNVEQIVATHWHHDHWMTYDAVRAATNGVVIVGDKEVNVPAERIDRRIGHGDELKVGGRRVTILHTPGHTPGSICLKVGRALITGDTLFRGGPGRTSAPGDLGTIVDSIVSHLLSLPDHTMVMPGHGPDTTIADTRREHAHYARKPWPADYFGDVEWLKDPPTRSRSRADTEAIR
ncbi:MAG: MBL fold metallo-hydrolase [Chloroflexi bacterium]|nr:MBL fold metallo-hydrolase [Chloroflexota bacterium]